MATLIHKKAQSCPSRDYVVTKNKCDVREINSRFSLTAGEYLKYPNCEMLDLAFIFDASDSIGPDNFNRSIEFVRNLLLYMNIGMNETRVSNNRVPVAIKLPFMQSSSLMRFEHFGRDGGFLFCGTTNKKFLKFLKFDIENIHPKLLYAPLMRPTKAEKVAVKRLSNCNLQ